MRGRKASQCLCTWKFSIEFISVNDTHPFHFQSPLSTTFFPLFHLLPLFQLCRIGLVPSEPAGTQWRTRHIAVGGKACLICADSFAIDPRKQWDPIWTSSLVFQWGARGCTSSIIATKSCQQSPQTSSPSVLKRYPCSTQDDLLVSGPKTALLNELYDTV